MGEFGSEAATLLLFATPLLVFAKVVHGVAAGRMSLAQRGSPWAKAELGAWSLIAAVIITAYAVVDAFTSQRLQRAGSH